jgi:CRP-like cAMP-binding protein
MLPYTGFLATASDDLRQLLDELASDVKLERGEVLFHEGDPGDALFAIVEGACEVSVVAQDGRKLALDIMQDGALIGEIALFDPGPRTATVTAAQTSHLKRVRNADLLQEITRRPLLAIDMIHLAGQRMRWMSRQLHEQAFLPVPARLARKVLHLTVLPSGKSSMELALSQSELAEFVGATREAVSKTLAAWKRQGIIEASRGGLKVLDTQSLSLLADLDQI